MRHIQKQAQSMHAYCIKLIHNSGDYDHIEIKYMRCIIGQRMAFESSPKPNCKICKPPRTITVYTDATWPIRDDTVRRSVLGSPYVTLPPPLSPVELQKKLISPTTFV